MSNTAIADHALLSDRHSSALVDRSGSVEWLSFPRFDSPLSSVGYWAQMRGTGASRQAETGQALAATWTGRWCWRPPSPRQRVYWGSRICSHSGRTMAGIGSAGTCRISWYDGSPAGPARSR